MTAFVESIRSPFPSQSDAKEVFVEKIGVSPSRLLRLVSKRQTSNSLPEGAVGNGGGPDWAEACFSPKNPCHQNSDQHPHCALGFLHMSLGSFPDYRDNSLSVGGKSIQFWLGAI